MQTTKTLDNTAVALKNNTKFHAIIQSYFNTLYARLDNDIQHSMHSQENEIYGELYYYSVVKLLKYLDITAADHFLDVGSGLGRLVLQIFFTTNATSVTGIEINQSRHNIACVIKESMQQQLPDMFASKRCLNLILANFLTHTFNNVSIIYVCSTVFSADLLAAIGDKINTMYGVRKVVSLRKLPTLTNFTLTKKIFLHGTWDKSACYIYTQII